MYIKEKDKNDILFDFMTGEYRFTSAGLKEKFDHNQSLVVPINICWLIENRCNLNCIYCFSEYKNKCSVERNFESIIENILSLNPKTITLTGGEPTLNNNLKEIIETIGSRAITIIDTNGTTDNLEKIIPVLFNSIVRISIDSLSTKVLEKVRPSKKISYTSRQIPMIFKNINLLIEHGVPVIVQTVVTKENINELENIYEYLLSVGIERWYLSAVKYSEKCDNNFSDIALSSKDINFVSHLVNTFDNDKIYVTFSKEKNDGARSRLFVEKSGNFFIDTITDGIRYVGKNPYRPMHEEVCASLDIKKHYDLYLNKSNIRKKNR